MTPHISDNLLMATSSTNAINLHLSTTLLFNPVADSVTAAKAQPSRLLYGSAGNGSSQPLSCSMFLKATEVNVTHVPYRGSGSATVDLIAAHLDLMLDTGSMPHLKSGSLNALAVAAAEQPARCADI